LYAELATERLPENSDAARECLDVVTSESARLGRLIGNVLTFSKHQHGRLQPRLAKVNLAATLLNTVEQFRPSLEEKGVQISLELEPVMQLETDADMVGQIIGNLLSNVEKYAAGGKAVRIVSKRGNGVAEISVMDQGPGIPKGLCERIFEPFYRISDKLSDGTTGTGIGLGISRELARLLGGNLIALPSPASGGSHFLLTLPIS
jgi:signal transduction histidine kinase